MQSQGAAWGHLQSRYRRQGTKGHWKWIANPQSRRFYLDFSPWHVYFGHTAILKQSQNSVSRGCNQVTQLISACYRVEFYHLTLSEWSTVRPKNIFQFFNILLQVTCQKSNVLAVPLRLLFVASGNQPWLAGNPPTVHYFPIKIPFVSDFPISHVWLPKGVNQYSVHIPYPMNISLYHIISPHSTTIEVGSC